MSTDTKNHNSAGGRFGSLEVLGIVGLSLVALLTRAYGIWDWSISGDEYPSVAFATERASLLINPAHYVLVGWSTKLFGSASWVVRLPSVIFGTLSIPVFYWACRSVLGRSPAFLGSPIFIF